MQHIIDNKIHAAISFPNNSNLVNYSKLFEFYNKKPYRSFCIKYVIDGNEYYTVNGKKYNIGSSQYLIANAYSEGDVLVDSKKQVTGICIDIEPTIISEAVSSYIAPGAYIADLGLDTFFNTANFYENLFEAKHTQLGKLIANNEKHIEENVLTGKDFSREFYFQLTEKIICDYIPVFKQFQNIKTVKLSTKKDLFYKLNKAKLLLEANFLKNPTITDVALHVGISEYHFYRLFKSVFSYSPNQYVIKLKLDFARQQLISKKNSIAEVAFKSGFSDLAAFSKSFKQQFNISPTTLIKN